ncbi:MAG: hypothetical protein ACRDI1_07270 [Actinomycetota bacterium]
MNLQERIAQSKLPLWLRDILTRPERLIAVAGVIMLLALIAVVSPSNLPGRVATQDDGDSGLRPGERGSKEDKKAEKDAAAKKSGSGAGAGSAAAGSGALPPGVPPPVTATEMRVGIAYVEDPGAANAAAGFAGIGQIDQKRGWDAMVNEVNKNPPHGRKVVPVYYSYTTNDIVTKGAAQIAQEMCDHWTKDNRVFMAWASGTDNLRACLTKAGVAQLGEGSGFSYDTTWRDYPWLVEHNSSALDRMAEFSVDQLHARGLFDECKDHPSTAPCVDGKPRIGLIRYDWPAYDAGAERLKKALAKHNLSLCNGCEFEITYSNDSIPEQLNDATEVNNAINACRTARTVPAPGDTSTPAGPCTHMLFLGSTAGVRITLFYVQRAEDQGYRARLGFNTLDAPDAVRDFFAGQGQDEKYNNQFTKSLLVSYNPARLNLRPQAFKDCMKLFTDAGETFGGSDDTAGNKKNQIDGLCDTAWYHIAAFNAAGPEVTLDTWLNGVANTGQVKSAGTFLMRTTAERRDGAGATRIGDWDAGKSCKCWKPVTGDIPV